MRPISRALQGEQGGDAFPTGGPATQHARPPQLPQLPQQPQTDAPTQAQTNAQYQGPDPSSGFGRDADPVMGSVPNNTHAEDQLAHHLKALWSDALYAKRPHEDDMFRALRQRRGDYDPQLIQSLREAGGSEIFFKLTEMKVRAVKSWINDVIKNSGTRPWTLEPTPLPELPVDAEQRMTQAVQSLLADGFSQEEVMQVMDGAPEAVLAELQKEAKEKAKKMSRQIEDQLVEAKFARELDGVVDDFATFKAAFMLGPMTRRVRKVVWETQGGQMLPKIEGVLQVDYQRRSPFDVYPAPSATTVDDGYVFVHERYTTDALWNLRDVPGASRAKIDWLLREYGQRGLRGWLDFVQDERRNRAEGRYYQQFAQENTIDALRYMGTLPGYMLARWGVTGVEDSPRPYDVEALLIKNMVVRVRLNPNPSGKKPLYKACALPIPGAFWGQTFPSMMQDHQDMINYAARSLAENMSMASGPQVALSAQAAQADSAPTRIHAWKVWLLDTEDMAMSGSGRLPVEFFQPDMNANELLGVINSLMVSVDQITGVPAYLGGDEQGARSGAAGTASGLSMLMGASAKGMREMLSQIGDMMADVIEGLYMYNMLYNPDLELKGDAQVKTGGFVALLQQETTQMRRQEFLQLVISNPLTAQILGVDGARTLMRELAGGLEVDVDQVVAEQGMDGAPIGPDGLPMDPAMAAQGAAQGGAMGPMGPQVPQPGEGARTADQVA